MVITLVTQPAGQQGSQNHVGETFLRGIQMTDVNGQVQFLTKFPGWYPGRIAHIHFQIFLNSVLQVTSQLTFPIADKNAIYTANLPYSNYGSDPLLPANDNVFSDGTALQMTTLNYNAATSQYEVFLEVGVNATGTTVGLLNIEPETGGQFKLQQNFPNPYTVETTIPFILTNPSDVKIEWYDLSGKKVAEVKRDNLPAGEQKIKIDIHKLGIAKGNYVYQLVVTNSIGVHSQCKMMSAA